jgi:hypothetical protein
MLSKAMAKVVMLIVSEDGGDLNQVPSLRILAYFIIIRHSFEKKEPGIMPSVARGVTSPWFIGQGSA